MEFSSLWKLGHAFRKICGAVTGAAFFLLPWTSCISLSKLHKVVFSFCILFLCEVIWVKHSSISCDLGKRFSSTLGTAWGFSQISCFLAGVNLGCRTFKMGSCRRHSWLGFWWHLLYLHIFRRRKCTLLNYIICIVCRLLKFKDVNNFKLWGLDCLTSALWILHQIVEPCLQLVSLTGWCA